MIRRRLLRRHEAYWDRVGFGRVGPFRLWIGERWGRFLRAVGP